jgi:hypothetical protein
MAVRFWAQCFAAMLGQAGWTLQVSFKRWLEAEQRPERESRAGLDGDFAYKLNMGACCIRY